MRNLARRQSAKFPDSDARRDHQPDFDIWTLFTGVTRDMGIAREEIFGPVVTVTVFDTEDDAVSIANESDYGLLCGVYSRDQERVFRVAHRIDTGMVLVNNGGITARAPGPRAPKEAPGNACRDFRHIGRADGDVGEFHAVVVNDHAWPAPTGKEEKRHVDERI